MCKLKAADFYYGSFLSALINGSGSRPVLFDETESRRIYRVETNHMSECYVFTKFVTERKMKNTDRSHWIFNFSSEEILNIQELFKTKGNVKLALICVKENFCGSELAVIDYNDAMDCLGVDMGVKAYRINIKTYNNKHGLRIYGSGRNDKINGLDNTLKITRSGLADM